MSVPFIVSDVTFQDLHYRLEKMGALHHHLVGETLVFGDFAFTKEPRWTYELECQFCGRKYTITRFYELSPADLEKREKICINCQDDDDK